MKKIYCLFALPLIGCPNPPNPFNELLAVWGSDGGHLWAVGDQGTILKGDGRSWELITDVSPQRLHSVWGSDANNVWAVGFNGDIWYWNGSTWTPQDSGTRKILLSVWGSSADSIWAAGDAGILLKFDGRVWSPQPSGTTNPLASIWGLDARNVWAAGSQGTILRWNAVSHTQKCQVRHKRPADCYGGGMLPVDTMDPLQWAQFLFGRAALGDQRRTRRLVSVAAALARHPGSPPGRVCSASSAELEGANRFFRNPGFSAQDILQSGFLSTSHLVESLPPDEEILSIQDSTTLGYDHSVRHELGDLGGPADSSSRGWFVHSNFLWSQDRGPLGLIAQQWLLRDPAQRGKRHKRHERDYQDKESFKWQRSYEQMEQLVGEEAARRIVSVCDSEADIYLLLHFFVQKQARFVVRAAWDRRLQGPQEPLSLRPHLQAAAVRGLRTVAIPQRQGRPARTAQLEVRSARLKVQRPATLTAQQAPASVQVHVVYAHELDAPKDAEGLDWMLLTSEPIETEEQLNRVLSIYEMRWKIEEFHKAWKCGTKVEELKQQSAENLQKAAVILGFIAVRLLQLKDRMEAEPEQSCETVLLPREWKMLWVSVEKKKPLPPQAPSLQWAYRALARLGHWSDTKRTGRASWEALWRGWQRLCDVLLGYLAAQALFEAKM